MKKILLSIAIISAIVLAPGCSANNEAPAPVPASTNPSASEPVPTETKEPDPTLSPVPPDPRNATDNQLVNDTIIQLLDLDIEALTGKIQLLDVACTTADGLGGPPKCPEGIEDGTNVTFFPVLGPGEGAQMKPDEVDKLFDYQDPSLYQIILVEPLDNPDDSFPEGRYAVILSIEPKGFARTFRLNGEGSIVRVDYTTWSPVEESNRITGEVIFEDLSLPIQRPEEE